MLRLPDVLKLFTFNVFPLYLSTAKRRAILGHRLSGMQDFGSSEWVWQFCAHFLAAHRARARAGRTAFLVVFLFSTRKNACQIVFLFSTRKNAFLIVFPFFHGGCNKLNARRFAAPYQPHSACRNCCGLNLGVAPGGARRSFCQDNQPNRRTNAKSDKHAAPQFS